MYYSAFDLQTGGYFHTGRNSKTKRECAEAMAGYFNGDAELEDEINPKEPDLINHIESYEVRIEAHKKKMKEGF